MKTPFKKARDIKVGVVGYGGAFNMGRAHLQQMKGAGMTPVAVCEIDEARLEVARQDFPGIETYDSIDAMLEASDVNLITIITPHNTHAEIALKALNAGKSVCCEKPLAITTEECDQMIAAAKKNKVVLTTYHNRHWDGGILEAMQIVKKEKAIGDIVRIECHTGAYGQPRDWWRSSKTISGGILYDWGVHLMEYSLQLLGPAKLTEVSGFARQGHWSPKTAWKQDTIEDDAYLVARFDTGQWLSLSVTHIDACAKAHDRKMVEVTGTKGTLLFDPNSYKLIPPQADGSVLTRQGRNPGTPDKYYKNVARHMVRGTKLIIDGPWSRRPIHIIDLAMKSIKAGKSMKAKYA
ncbi:MAG: Gfo/Idh/MocA family oxidoreductase [Verrucomicrobia bacterium]|jgi:scyllo-inositol 2-dehydrogenase (NADP+)|nr:Gfo/Idh/MocA family oxidoreductase [Verrucomicrobiota bacterium]MBT7068955.1 Gfo/Idh/MocA family oxidoreductase [Verrucomicrobiota bacterium]MBT7701586.1 Gfo/Idh/MocA family oxidoreductase [Verrucomicrobiota bacterium]